MEPPCKDLMRHRSISNQRIYPKDGTGFCKDSPLEGSQDKILMDTPIGIQAKVLSSVVGQDLGNISDPYLSHWICIFLTLLPEMVISLVNGSVADPDPV